jgi:GNAT superfamily N-acetyltransferase
MIIERVEHGDAERFQDVFLLLTRLHIENGMAPMNREKAAEAVYRVIEEGMTWLARDEKDEHRYLGVLGLVEHQFWYADLTFLVSAWFYVRPERRFGRVGVELLRAAQAEAEKRGLIVFAETSNPRRRAKGGSWLTVASERAGYIPAGYMIRLGGREHVRGKQDHAEIRGENQEQEQAGD